MSNNEMNTEKLVNSPLKAKIPQSSILFAPMEGITDGPYRLAISKTFPEWGLFFTDFLRIPKEGKYSPKKIIQHFDKRVYDNERLRNKTAFQILTGPQSETIDTVLKIQELGLEHLDLNLGCPSKRVNSHKGGAWLLSELTILRHLVCSIRKHFKKYFTVKIRIGFKDDSNFENLIHLLEEEGVDAITIHARTRDQLYKGIADWNYIKRAVEISSIPIVGNGDIWHARDIESMFLKTNCHAVMLGRGALKTPWMPLIYDKFKGRMDHLDDDDLLFERKKYLDLYFYQLEKEYKKIGLSDSQILGRFKSMSHQLFNDYHNHEFLRSNFLRAKTLDEFLHHIEYSIG